MKRVPSYALMLAALVACRDSRRSPTAPHAVTVLPAIVDARNDDARPGFYFLAPIGPVAFPVPWSGVFDATLSPVVEICEWSGTACASPLISRLTMTDGLEIDRVHVFPDFQEYAVLWRTRDLGLREDRTYRIRVLVAGTELGFADVDVVRRLQEFLAIDRSEYVGLLKDFILPIRFRIERGAVFVIGAGGGTISIAGGAATLTVPASSLKAAIGLTARQLASVPDPSHTVNGTAYDFGPDGTVFDPPATLTLKYDETKLPPGTDERRLRVLEFQNGTWQTVAGSTVSVDANTVTAPIRHFTEFAAGPGMANLVLHVTGGQGSVSVSDGSSTTQDCSYTANQCQFSFPAATSLTLVATPGNPDMRFEQWTSTSTGFTCTTNSSCTVVMDQDRDVSAVFSVPGIVSLDHRSAAFNAVQGASASPVSDIITVTNIGGRDLQLPALSVVYAQQVRPWLQATLSSQTVVKGAPQTLTLSVLPNLLPPGQYKATLPVGDAAVSLALVDVTYTVGSSVLYAFDGTGKQFGPRPIIAAIFTSADGSDIYPVGPTESYIFTLFDTGSDFVYIGADDSNFLNIGAASKTNGNQNTHVRIDGMSAIDPVSLTAPIGAHGAAGGAQAEVSPVRVGPALPPQRADLMVTLIGAPVVNEVIARIDNTASVTRGPYAQCACSLTGPDIMFYMPSDPGIPTPGLQLQLERFGGTAPALLDNATNGQKYFIDNVVFTQGTHAVMDSPTGTQPIRYFVDTGSPETIINVRVANALGLDLSTPGSFDCFVGLGKEGNEGYVIDRISLVGTTSSGAGTYAIDHAAVCVDIRNQEIRTQYSNPGGSPAVPKVDAIIGANLFMHAPILFNGKNNVLGILVP